MPDARLNIITGETGAGKSIMLGALGLIMGSRADTKALYDESEKCVVEGEFDLQKLDLQAFFETNELDFEPKCIIRREVSPQGKSRAFINDTPVNLDTLRELGIKLMDIHSQHDTLMLGSNVYQLRLLDVFAGNQKLLSEFYQAFKNYKQAEKAYHELSSNAKALKKEFDFNKFQHDEIENANLAQINLNELESELMILENAEDVKLKLSVVQAYLSENETSVLPLIHEANNSLNGIANLSETYKSFKDRLQSVSIELKDLVNEITHAYDIVEIDPQRQEFIADKISNVNKLLQKHGFKNTQELIDLKANLADAIDKVLNFDSQLEALLKSQNETLKICEGIAVKLSESRTKNAGILAKEITEIVRSLGMPDANVEIKINPKTLAQDGIDDVLLLFSANKGISPKSLKEVASGGEFSRLMLSIKYILAKKSALPTIIFDEIDSGISGEVAMKVGKIMQEMAQYMQVISITHLHQIAGKAHVHYYVYKDNTASKTISLMRRLDNQERIEQIAKMIGGENPSQSALQSAKELIGN